jgi:heat shock protein HslJ
VWLIQQCGNFAEYSARFRHPGDLNAVPDDRGGAFPEEKKPACLRTGSEHDFSGLVGCERKSGEALLKGDAIRVGNGHGTSTP